MLLTATVLVRLLLVVFGAAAAYLTIRWSRRGDRPPGYERRFFVVILILMQVVYVVFVLARSGAPGLGIEAALLGVFTVIALLGLKWHDAFLLVGYLGHGAWDLTHFLGTAVYAPPAYPELCVGYDWLMLVYLIFRIPKWREATL